MAEEQEGRVAADGEARAEGGVLRAIDLFICYYTQIKCAQTYLSNIHFVLEGRRKLLPYWHKVLAMSAPGRIELDLLLK